LDRLRGSERSKKRKPTSSAQTEIALRKEGNYKIKKLQRREVATGRKDMDGLEDLAS